MNARLLFKRIYQTVHTADELSATVFFDVLVDDVVRAHDVEANVRMTPGADYLTEVLEVRWPDGYTGPRVRYECARDCIEAYYRAAVGPEGWAIRGWMQGVSMARNTFARETACDCELAGPETW